MLTSLSRVLIPKSLPTVLRSVAKPRHVEKTLSKQIAAGRYYSHQQSLPRLPVPPLQQTIQKYLKSVKPILTEEDYQYTSQMLNELGKPGGVGEKLQKFLEQRAEVKDNWLDEYWTHYAYLDFRLPVTINVSPGIMFPIQNFKDQDGQLDYAAKLVAGVLDYKLKIDNETIPVDTLGGNPLCMHQYYCLLSSCRIPGKKTDTHVTFPGGKSDSPRHITVCSNNHIFSMDVYDESGKPLGVEEIRRQLIACLDRSRYPGPPVGILTTENRNSWGKIYSTLIKDKDNKRYCDIIQRSIFTLCLDQPIPCGEPDERASMVANQMNHGGGAKWNSNNRWFDKTLQFIVGSDGAVGMTYEHTTAEGPAIISIVDHVLNYVQKSFPRTTTVEDIPVPKKLKFNYTPELEESMEHAQIHMDSAIEDLDMSAFSFDDFGKNVLKKHKTSPDAFIQVNFQLAFYRLYGYSVATYESGSLRKFQKGRTDTIRSCTIESHEFCTAMDKQDVPMQEKAKLFKNAIKAHRNLIDEVVAGQGIDRHLLGLKLIAVENGMNVPEFFMDPVYSSTMHYRLSTSQVPSKQGAMLCFGPVVPDGYGLCYNPMSDSLKFSVSAWNRSPETDSKRFINSLRKSLLDTRDLLTLGQSSKL